MGDFDKVIKENIEALFLALSEKLRKGCTYLKHQSLPPAVFPLNPRAAASAPH